MAYRCVVPRRRRAFLLIFGLLRRVTLRSLTRAQALTAPIAVAMAAWVLVMMATSTLWAAPAPVALQDGDTDGVYLVSDRVMPYGDTFVSCNGLLYFSGGDPAGVPTDEAVGNELWRSDGTRAGTTMVTEIWPGPDYGSPWWPACVAGRIFFSATDPIHGRELWISDGTAVGTYLVKDIHAGPGDSMLGVEARGATIDGIYYFRADDELHGEELWRSDGTEEGTWMVKNIHPTAGSEPRMLTRLGTQVCFSADDDDHGRELWCSDGTADGTMLTKDIFPLGADSTPILMEVLGTHLYFKARDGISGLELWRTDGTETGTHLVKDINPGLRGSGPIAGGDYAGFQDRLYFRAYHPDSDYELWVSDGTAAGTYLLKDLDTSGIPDRSIPNEFTVVENHLFFTANVGDYGRELWLSDGTEVGTRLVRDIREGFQAASSPHYLTPFGGLLYFEANAVDADGELWVSDGTEFDTQQVADLAPGTGTGSWPAFLTVVGEHLFFTANADGVENRLWALGPLPVDAAIMQTATPVTGIVAGDMITLMLTLENRGNIPLTGVTLAETLPVSMTLQHALTESVILTPTVGGPEVHVWSVSDLPVDHRSAVTLTALVDPAWVSKAPLIITAELGAAEVDTQPDNNLAIVILNGRQTFLPLVLKP